MIVKFKCKHILICNGKGHPEKLVGKKKCSGTKNCRQKKKSQLASLTKASSIFDNLYHLV